MAAILSQTYSDETPRRRATTTTGRRKVYGKRRTDAPRAVFDQRSPAKKTEADAIQDVVDCIEARLAEIQIADKAVVEDKQEEDDKKSTNTATATHKHIDDKNFAPRPPQHPAESVQFEQAIPKSTPVVKKRYQTMVEVRITPRKVLGEPQCDAKTTPKELPDHSDARKRNTKRARLRRCAPSDYVSNDKAASYVRSILDETLSPVAAQGIQKFDAWAARAGQMLEVVKLAEGSYGEVYKLRLREDLCQKGMSKSKLARLRACGDGVFKVVPLRAQSGPGSKKFTSVEEIVAEVKMLKYLDPIPGFARLREIHVVQGRYPDTFQRAWDHYKKTKDDCLNPNPSSKRAYPDSQIWAIIEMDDAGSELEKFSWSSIFQIYDIFWGVAMALARAEEYALFEHRDLHLGNVCIRSTRPDGLMHPPSVSEVMRQSNSSGFGLSTLQTTLIDYSLSRAELVVDETSELIEVTSSDLDKKQIFDAIGIDEDDALLRDTYRHMRAQVYKGNPVDAQKTPDIPGIWAEYAPRTNLVWLRFLLKMLLKNKKDEPRNVTGGTPRPPLAPRPSNTEVKRATKSGKNHSAGTDIQVISDDCAQVSQLKQTLKERLNAILELLDLEHGHEDMCCSADLVAFAIDAQWLHERDFFSAE
ncbi:hypothetical protein BJY04DRAFT_177431 [Aspergillus karnatakaensis]|uniref:uncharacterized protein n=1 Tax=Aspergillus karnatakaensis TaxID=1810916 RepID=UPI003CCDA793